MLIVLIGVDGSGKTTAARALVASVRDSGGKALLLSNHAARRRMSIISRQTGWRLPSRPADAIETVIRVSNVLVSHLRAWLFLKNNPGALVVMDRHLHCQLALRRAQGLGPGRFVPWLLKRLPSPDVVGLVEVAPERAYQRVTLRATDEETLEHLTAFRAAYRSLPGSDQFAVVDANGNPDDVLEELKRVIRSVEPAPA